MCEGLKMGMIRLAHHHSSSFRFSSLIFAPSILTFPPSPRARNRGQMSDP